MKKLKKYIDFSRINENIVNDFANYISSVFDFLVKNFKDKASGYYDIYLSKKNQLPRDEQGRAKVILKVPRSWYNDKVYDEIDKYLGEDDVAIKDNIVGSQEYSMSKNENVVDTNSKYIENLDVKFLRKLIIFAYTKQLGIGAGRFGEDDIDYKGGPLFIWGAPGIGKTQITNQIAKELDIKIQIWTLATLDPTDFKGIPFIVKVKNALFGKRTQTAVPSVLPKSNWNGRNDKGGILFLDEFNRGHPSVHNAALSLINNGKIDDYVLPSRWLIVAAGNKLSDLANLAGTEMSAEMQNRFMHVNLVPNIKDLKKHVKDADLKFVNPEILEFLSFDQAYLHKMSDDANILQEYPAYATPRKWLDASKEHYFTVDSDWSNEMDKDELYRIYADHIGGDAASQFVNFVDFKKNYNVDDILDVYENGAKAKRTLPTNSQGRIIMNQAYGAILAISSYISNQNKKITPKELRNVYEYALTTSNDELAELFMNKIRHYNKLKDTDIDTKLMKVRTEMMKKWYDKIRDTKEKLKGLNI